MTYRLDPRAQPVYGRTINSPGRSRLFRNFPVLARTTPDHEQWDEDDGGASGSSTGPRDEPYALTPSQAVEQSTRHMERRLRRALEHGNKVAIEVLRIEAEAKVIEARLRAFILRRDTAAAVLEALEGRLTSIAPDNGVAHWEAVAQGDGQAP